MTTLATETETERTRWLAELRRIAALPEPAALEAVESFVAGVRASWTEDAEWSANLRAETRASLTAALERMETLDPANWKGWEADQVRQRAALLGNGTPEALDARQRADRAEGRYLTHTLHRLAQTPLDRAERPWARLRDVARCVDGLRRVGQLTPAAEQDAEAARELAARYRSDRALAEAEVAAVANPRKAERLRAEAQVMLRQDRARAGLPPADDAPGERGPAHDAAILPAIL